MLLRMLLILLLLRRLVILFASHNEADTPPDVEADTPPDTQADTLAPDNVVDTVLGRPSGIDPSGINLFVTMRPPQHQP